MIPEQKQLLFADLCARLPYGVKIHIDFINSTRSHIIGDATLDTITSQTNQTFDFVDFEQDYNNGDVAPIHGYSGGKLLMVDEFKPYLRSMSSMTEEENEELKYEIELELQALASGGGHNTVNAAPAAFEIDFYNKHHFDYRGLIPMGLALEAPEGMYKID